ncbi:MAG: hypothetical protein RLZZ450_564 [Pseudomonadota bacterium]|jgi:uncharacterized MAPEG superfamily protein
MTIEMKLLAWTLVLAVVQILLPATLRTRETGPAYNMGPRDTPGPPIGTVTGRLIRAQHNLFETLPLFIGAVLLAHVTDREGALTTWGAALYFGGRVIYVPLYAFGIPGVRSAAFTLALTGLLMVLVAVLA